MVIPGNYWTQTDLEVVEVACPCGETPTLFSWAPTYCSCGRMYAHIGSDVRVYFSPKETLPVGPEADES